MFFFQTHFRSVKCNGVPAMTRATQKEQATTTLEKKNIEHPSNVLPASLASFISGLGAKVRG